MERKREAGRVVRFDAFELDLRTGILQRDGQRLPLQERPLQVLTVLLERAGELVTRDELRERLWGSDTFVEFEDNLNHAVSKVRQTLGDSAATPKFVETLPRRGYRFIAPVEEIAPGDAGPKWRRFLLTGILAAAAGMTWWLSSPRTETVSLAVLPLDNLSADPEQEYFADGLTEAVITELAKIRSLRVISRQSVMQFKESLKPLPEIASDLGVSNLVEGSVSKTEGEIHITVQLIATSPERHLWAETFDRRMIDIFAIQKEVAEQIAAALNLTLSEEEQEILERRPTQNAEAYNLVMVGDHFSARDTVWDLEKAVDYYHQALRLDVSYAEALAKSAEASHRLALYSRSHKEWWTRAVDEAQRALELDDRSAFAHLAQALVQEKLLGDMDSAEESYLKALELDPQVANTHLSYGGFLCGRGRLSEALITLKRAHEIDPLGYRMNEHLARIYLVLGEFDKALEHSRRIFDYHPALMYGPMWLAATYLHLGEYEKVGPWLQRVLPVAPDWYQLPPILLAWSYLYQSRFEEASQGAERVLSVDPRSGWGNEFAGMLALWTQDYEKALSHYERVKASPLYSFIWRAPVAHHRTRLGYSLYNLGRRVEAEVLFAECESLCKKRIAAGDERYGFHEVLAMIEAIRGNEEASLSYLQQAIEAGWRWDDVASKDPIWQGLQDEPGFLGLMAEVGMKRDRMRRRVKDMEQAWTD